MTQKDISNDSAHNKNRLETSDRPTVDKSQENYPGPRVTDQAPEFVQDWEGEPPRNIAPLADEANSNQDLGIQHQIVEKLKQEIDGFENINVHVEHGAVTLTGNVRYEAVKSNVAVVIRKCEGVTELNNNLTVES